MQRPNMWSYLKSPFMSMWNTVGRLFRTRGQGALVQGPLNINEPELSDDESSPPEGDREEAVPDDYVMQDDEISASEADEGVPSEYEVVLSEEDLEKQRDIIVIEDSPTPNAMEVELLPAIKVEYDVSADEAGETIASEYEDDARVGNLQEQKGIIVIQDSPVLNAMEELLPAIKVEYDVFADEEIAREYEEDARVENFEEQESVIVIEDSPVLNAMGVELLPAIKVEYDVSADEAGDEIAPEYEDDARVGNLEEQKGIIVIQDSPVLNATEEELLPAIKVEYDVSADEAGDEIASEYEDYARVEKLEDPEDVISIADSDDVKIVEEKSSPFNNHSFTKEAISLPDDIKELVFEWIQNIPQNAIPPIIEEVPIEINISKNVQTRCEKRNRSDIEGEPESAPKRQKVIHFTTEATTSASLETLFGVDDIQSEVEDAKSTENPRAPHPDDTQTNTDDEDQAY